MPLSTVEIAKARDTANKILDELLLDAYVFELEPRDDVWELTIECACDVDGGWVGTLVTHHDIPATRVDIAVNGNHWTLASTAGCRRQGCTRRSGQGEWRIGQGSTEIHAEQFQLQCKPSKNILHDVVHIPIFQT